MRTASLRLSPDHLLGDGLRYAVAACGAALVDLASAWCSHAVLGLALPLSAALGVLAGGLMAYILMEFWAFRRPESAFSVRRLTGLLGVVTLTLILRTAIVAGLDWAFPAPWAALPILMAAFGVTFTVNFAVNRFVIFGRVSK